MVKYVAKKLGIYTLAVYSLYPVGTHIIGNDDYLLGLDDISRSVQAGKDFGNNVISVVDNVKKIGSIFG